MSGIFKLVSPFRPAGDQPAAIDALCKNISEGRRDQILLGVTGSGKTFSIASVIEKLDRPALILSHNKVLAAQLYAEFRSFFPENAVEYFISYYDYYQPEAYIPQSDTYIEKDAQINEHIDKLRLKATTSLLTRRDTIVVASVSCIYNIGSPESYSELCVALKKGATLSRADLTAGLIQIYYDRNEVEFTHGKFRVRGGAVDIFPPYSQTALRVELTGSAISSIREIHPLTGDILNEIEEAWVYPAKHFVTTKEERERAIGAIKEELAQRLEELKGQGKLLEAERLSTRTKYDMEMLSEMGYCGGVENYSRHLSGRPPGARPLCLMDYFAARKSRFPDEKDYLLFLDESHVSVPQIRGMYEGDRSRKQTLVDFGFRLPSALDNRPLKFAEFQKLAPQTVYVSATPGPYELERAGVPQAAKGEKMPYAGNPLIVEQVIRPTGLVDPPVTMHPTKGQIDHLVGKIKERALKGEKSLVLSLTKKTAEDLSAFLISKGIRAKYLHSDIDTLERVEILGQLRKGALDAIVGINLLREGLDLPEVSLVAILEADNEGFLRSESTLIQISGRAARHSSGEVILYADRTTGSMSRALNEMERRRKKQETYNLEHHITPTSIRKATVELEEFQNQAKHSGLGILHSISREKISPAALPGVIANLEKQMKEAADNLDFELAADLRDQLFELKEMGVKPGGGKSRPRKAKKQAR